VKGEFVVMDNISQLHARTMLGMGGRHMRRIHFN
jgi:alpha-ketoglutarate-dependent taurine dioxygenase